MIKKCFILILSLLILSILQVSTTHNIAMFKDDKNENSNEDGSSSKDEQS